MADEHKLRVGLIPLVGLIRAAQVFHRGNQQGGRKPDDWKEKPRQYFVEARLRHIIELDSGIDLHEDHEGSILANSLIIAWFDAQQTEVAPMSFDDLNLP